MYCHHSTEGSQVTTILPETQALTADMQTQCQTPGILLDQLSQKAQGIPHVPTRTHLVYTAAAVRLEQGLVAVLVHNPLNL